MRGFFSNMTFSRWVIVVALLSSFGLGWMVFQNFQRLAAVQAEVDRAPILVREVQANALRLNGLQRAAAKEGLRGEENDPELYIRRVAQKDRVNIGQVNTSVSTSTPQRGVLDRHYTIKPANRNESFSRGRIGNFLFTLESDSRRVKVTSLELSPVDTVRPGEIGEDVWTFDATITSRQATE